MKSFLADDEVGESLPSDGGGRGFALPFADKIETLLKNEILFLILIGKEPLPPKVGGYGHHRPPAGQRDENPTGERDRILKDITHFAKI